MTRLRKVKNTSTENVDLVTPNARISLSPGDIFDSSIDVSNLEDIKDSISYTADLTEVGEKTNKVPLFD